MNQIQNFVQSYPSEWALAGASLCGVAAIEMAIHTIKGIPHLANGTAKERSSFSANLGGTVFYALCAANIIPHTALIGSLIFTAYSIVKHNDSDCYLTSKILGGTISKIWENTVVPTWNHVVAPLGKRVFNDLIVPVSEAITNVFAAIFNLISLPKHPVWLGVATLGLAIGVSKALA